MALSLVESVAALKLPHEKNSDYGIVTVSIGGVSVNPASGHVATLFREADALLYKAKENGRNRCEIS